jgi:hypothetical protein
MIAIIQLIFFLLPTFSNHQFADSGNGKYFYHRDLHLLRIRFNFYTAFGPVLCFAPRANSLFAVNRK